MLFKGKKVLLVGLGILGGGVGTANLLLKEGALLTVTDLKSKQELKRSISQIQSKKVTYRLGTHDESDFRAADIIVFNQSVPYGSSWVKFAKKLGKPVESDLTIFSESLKKKRGRYIGITGTRGKTTTSSWIGHFLPQAALGGNMPEKGLSYLAGLGKRDYVLELSSFQLEYSGVETLPPKVAVITNLYVDHLNYHGTLQKYFEAKFKLFKNQAKKDFLIINRDNKNTPLILKARPKAKTYFFSLSPLPKKENGIFMKGENIIFQENGQQKIVAKLTNAFSAHQKSNLLPAMLAAHLYGESWSAVIGKIGSLPEVPMRQEIILNTKNLKVVNDSAATSPEAAIAAIDRFHKEKGFRLIAGGTDKELDFRDLAKKIKARVAPADLLLLEGSATKKLIAELAKLKYAKTIRTFKTLKDIIEVLPAAGTFVFSPAAASFEKFKNEFDRGGQFAKLIKAKFGATLGNR